MDESRPDNNDDGRSDDFVTIYESIYGTEFDPKVDYIRSTDNNGHYEQLWVSEIGKAVKVPPRTLFVAEKVISDERNKLRSMHDFVRDSFVRQMAWRHQQAKNDNNFILASELELELREMALQNKLAYIERALMDDKARRDGIMRILSTPYSVEVEMLATELIAALHNPDYVRQCRHKLEDFCSGPRGR